ncbi:LytR/AlgR family response regulator transcription factor [Granulicella mallensis]|uniref:Two component transcriptional regulator, LytTR family n=1 Tax=Granulicella mallensis (strain ATCC BAA-1857 / DSM 23137 / MP5ACTX8) TaxID=682795 RepID=G8NRY9_GRAMM|nr:LytTR family DNA-binding domain-containing protein [Granulicella mallensis]AEU35102.1 two component transcriptional regulator, LytTR family [Granulicella mallensis MP5ACTX8]
MRLRTVIADDEPLARDRLKAMLAGETSIEVAGECRNGRELVSLLKSEPVDLLFLDIQMPGNTGFEVVEQIGVARMPPTVFVTAHNEYAVRAFEVHALDYLTKPVELQRLQSALEHVRERIASKAALITQEQMQAIASSLQRGEAPAEPYVKRLLVPNGARETIVQVADIDWIEAADYYSRLHLGTKTYMLRQTVKQLVDSLDPARFVRVHRSTIVNIDRVKEILREGRADLWVVLTDGQRLKMSKAGWENLLTTGTARSL